MTIVLLTLSLPSSVIQSQCTAVCQQCCPVIYENPESFCIKSNFCATGEKIIFMRNNLSHNLWGHNLSILSGKSCFSLTLGNNIHFSSIFLLMKTANVIHLQLGLKYSCQFSCLQIALRQTFERLLYESYKNLDRSIYTWQFVSVYCIFTKQFVVL